MAIETFRIIHDMSPPLLSDLIVKKEFSYNFRYTNILQVPLVRTTSFGKRSFRYAAPTLWNSLPENFRQINDFNTFKNQISFWTGVDCKCSVCRSSSKTGAG